MIKKIYNNYLTIAWLITSTLSQYTIIIFIPILSKKHILLLEIDLWTTLLLTAAFDGIL